MISLSNTGRTITCYMDIAAIGDTNQRYVIRYHQENRTFHLIPRNNGRKIVVDSKNPKKGHISFGSKDLPKMPRFGKIRFAAFENAQHPSGGLSLCLPSADGLPIPSPIFRGKSKFKIAKTKKILEDRTKNIISLKEIGDQQRKELMVVPNTNISIKISEKELHFEVPASDILDIVLDLTARGYLIK